MQAWVPRVAPAAQQQFQRVKQGLPPRTSLPPTARLQGEPFSFGLAS